MKKLLLSIFLFLNISPIFFIGEIHAVAKNSRCVLWEDGNKGKAFSLTDALDCAQADSPQEKGPDHLPGVKNSEENVNVSKEIPIVIQKIISGLSLLAGSVAVLFIAINGFKLMFGGLVDSQVSEAKDGLIYAAVGLIVIIFSYVIAKTVIALTYIAG